MRDSLYQDRSFYAPSEVRADLPVAMLQAYALPCDADRICTTVLLREKPLASTELPETPNAKEQQALVRAHGAE
jgi:hypothetical protein